ncbi:hypothetical protein K435DRAFT_869401 [Dendrothele bispora CBS 962.96]|uniref:Uncharacterized protein n=1 Tax=Dendrothele bispora (strain CBS 962.96) TaxID=1314807 RepID=A0A4S8L9B9_DENBC|nr:hypothetical protein K435DRAFT_869401 [Dendrothele bispora CBS 962.96]
MSPNAHRCPNHSTPISCMETGAVTGCSGTPAIARLSSPSQSSSTTSPSNLEGVPQTEVASASRAWRIGEEALDLLPSEKSSRAIANDATPRIGFLRQQLNGVTTIQAYRGNPTQAFSSLYEILDGMFTRVYEATIRVHGEEREAALESLESLVTRMETLQSFLRRIEATSRRFTGEERDRSQNERFLLSNIPPQVTLPQFHVTLERTRLPYPESRRGSSRPSFTPPNTPTDMNGRGLKRVRSDLEDGEIVAKRRC